MGIRVRNLSDDKIFNVANSRLGLYRRSAGDVMNYTLSPKILGLKTKADPFWSILWHTTSQGVLEFML